MSLRYLLCSLTMLAAAVAASAAEKPDTISMRRAFVDFPAPALDLLTKSMRLDMLDYYEADSIYSVANAMEGLSRLDTVTADYLKVEITPVTSLQLKLLKDRKGADLLMAVYTAGGDGQAPDSDVRFYDANLTELPAEKFLKYPRLKDFFSIPKGSLTSQKEIDSMIPFPTVEFEAYPGSGSLQARLTVENYINIDDFNIIKLFLKPQVTYTWDGKAFKQEK